MTDFGAEVPGIVKAADPQLEHKVQTSLERSYPAAHDVNRIYALTYSACMSCRIAANMQDCTREFDGIIDGYAKERNDEADGAQDYRSAVTAPLHAN